MKLNAKLDGNLDVAIEDGDLKASLIEEDGLVGVGEDG